MKNAAQEVTKISLIHPHACVQGTPGTKDGSDAAVLDSYIFSHLNFGAKIYFLLFSFLHPISGSKRIDFKNVTVFGFKM